MQGDEELFGSPDQVAVMRRAWALWPLLKDDPRYSFYGRWVSLSDPGEDAPERLASLARVQGAASCQYLPMERCEHLCADLQTRGITPVRHEQVWGGDDALTASRELLAAHPMPGGLSVTIVSRETSEEQLAALARLSLECEVLPVAGSTMRGETCTGVCLMATDSAGEPVATASSYLNNHPASAHAKDAFWGMLATRDDWRGKRVALLLGAQAIVTMWERHGVRAFTSSVKADNASSMAVCRKLGVVESDYVYLGAIDGAQFGDARITR